MCSQKRRVSKIIIIFIMFSIIFASVNIFKRSHEEIKKENSAKNEEGWKSDTSPITFDWYVNYPWFTTKWGNNSVSSYVTRKTGVSINFIAPSGNGTEKLNAMIDRESLPDFITINAWDDEYRNIIEEKLALPLEKLAEKYDAYFFKVTDKQKLEWYRENDGEVYCYPNFSLSIRDTKDYKEENPSNQTFLVRKDIYEAIGKPDMRTPEGFLSALEKAKEKFPTVNNQPLIPLGLDEFNDSGNLSLDSILPNFLAIPFEKESEFYDRLTDPEYVRWLKTLRKANELGLLSKDIFGDKRDQMAEKIVNGRYFAMLYQRTDMVEQQLELYNADKDKIYIPVDGPANSKLQEPRLSSDSISGWTVTFISKDCKNPDRAIKFLSYLISEEGNQDLYLGEKGVLWEDVDGKKQFKPEAMDLLNSDRKSFYEKYGAEKTYWMLMDTNLIKKLEAPEPEPLKILKDWTRGKTYNFSIYDHTAPYGDTEEGIAYSKINSKWKNTLKSLLLANSDDKFDKIFDEFLNYREREGYEKIQAYRQKKFEENKKRLNIK
ncbi:MULTISPECIES: extracellular solute-binding protein [Clostridium]|uniref:Extracellular solute-binding protein n=1 Tax=Clostridium cibarium TaxID=2762247 RepID=A0ABR8PSX6_9CLOT|nr:MULTISPECIES: extracellular solute-binding protein [Clostridium]MBD7911215.1 extracellular solute-binding protein [Clostridium cibarium]